MAIYEFEEKAPKIEASSYVHELAAVIGDVKIGADCFIGAGAVIRGDYGEVKIGNRTSVQENVVVHARANESCTIGSDVQLGHGSILHNCNVKDFAVVGLGARICDYSILGVWAIVGEGAVVPAKMEIPDGKVAVGVPARVLRDVTNQDKLTWGFYKQVYAELAGRYKKGLKKVS
ncbi:MAG TPA: gamma carbonic anhydrase family protein [Nitrososphaerales archaeon]|nr:gamma carbonic anhydrase family protein [Nitrososphaerales archaeon]